MASELRFGEFFFVRLKTDAAKKEQTGFLLGAKVTYRKRWRAPHLIVGRGGVFPSERMFNKAQAISLLTGLTVKSSWNGMNIEQGHFDLDAHIMIIILQG